MDEIFSKDAIWLLDALWVNQAGACWIARALYKERKDNVKDDTMSVDKWCMLKFEEAPYDEFE